MWNAFLKDLFKSIGCTDKIFFDDTTYAMRHIGIQFWCEITDYNLEFIASMGWNDMETLRIFYARRNQRSLERTMARLIG